MIIMHTSRKVQTIFHWNNTKSIPEIVTFYAIALWNVELNNEHKISFHKPDLSTFIYCISQHNAIKVFSSSVLYLHGTIAKRLKGDCAYLSFMHICNLIVIYIFIQFVKDFFSIFLNYSVPQSDYLTICFGPVVNYERYNSVRQNWQF